MFDEWLKIADFTVTAGVLVFVMVMARQMLTAGLEWLPKFHEAMSRQSQAVVDLADASKASQETQEATLATLRSVSTETDRQGGAISQLHSQHGEMLRLLQKLAGEKS